MPHTTGDLRFETCDSSGEDFLSYAKKERQVFKLTRGQNISIVSYSYLLRSINELQVFLDSRFFFFFFKSCLLSPSSWQGRGKHPLGLVSINTFPPKWYLGKNHTSVCSSIKDGAFWIAQKEAKWWSFVFNFFFHSVTFFLPSCKRVFKWRHLVFSLIWILS